MAIEVEGAVELTLRVRVPIAEGARLTGLLQELAALHGAEIVTAAGASISSPEVAQIAGPDDGEVGGGRPEAGDDATPIVTVRARVCERCKAAYVSRTHKVQCLGRPASIGEPAVETTPKRPKAALAERERTASMAKPALKNGVGQRVASTSTCRKCGNGYWTKAHREYCAKGLAVPDVMPKAREDGRQRRRNPTTHGVKLDFQAVEPDYSAHGELHALPRDAYEAEEEWIVREPANDGTGHTHTYKIPRTSMSESLGRCGCGDTRRYRTEAAA